MNPRFLMSLLFCALPLIGCGPKKSKVSDRWDSPYDTSSSGSGSESQRSVDEKRDALQKAEHGLEEEKITFTRKYEESPFFSNGSYRVVLNYPASPSNPERAMAALKKYQSAADAFLGLSKNEEISSKRDLVKQVLSNWEAVFTPQKLDEMKKAKLDAIAEGEKTAATLKELEEAERGLLVFGIGFNVEDSASQIGVVFSLVPKLATKALHKEEFLEAMNTYYLKIADTLDHKAGMTDAKRTELEMKQALIFSAGAKSRYETISAGRSLIWEQLEAKGVKRANGTWDLERFNEEKEDDGIQIINDLKQLNEILSFTPGYFDIDKLANRSYLSAPDQSGSSRDPFGGGLARSLSPEKKNLSQSHPMLASGEFDKEITKEKKLITSVLSELGENNSREALGRVFFKQSLEYLREKLVYYEAALASKGWAFRDNGQSVVFDEEVEKNYLTKNRFNEPGRRYNYLELSDAEHILDRLAKMLRLSKEPSAKKELQDVEDKQTLVRSLLNEAKRYNPIFGD